MSVRSDASTVPTAGMAALDISTSPATAGIAADNHVHATVDAARAADSALGEANALNTNHPEHPLRRTFVANIRASLGDLCLRKTKGTWAPSTEALRGIFQQSA
jgi:hypothetical protein